MNLKPEQRVWYRQTCRGGYGFQRDVPAIYEKQTSRRRVTIRVQLRDGQEKRISVDPINVRPRILPGAVAL